MKKYIYQSPHGDIPYVRMGKGISLFLILGFNSDIDKFIPLVEYLSQYFEVIMPELPGIGCKATFGGKKFVIREYANVYGNMIRDLHLSSYILGGFCLGGIITIEMLKKGMIPKAVLLFETFTDGSMIRPLWFQRPLLPLVRLANTNRWLRSKFSSILANRPLIERFVRIAFWNRKDLDEVVPYQARVITMMNAHAVIDVLIEVLTFDLFSGKKIYAWDIPTVSVCITHDPMLDMDAAYEELTKHFSRISRVSVDFDDHAPRGPMTNAQVQSLLHGVIPQIQKMISVKR